MKFFLVPPLGVYITRLKVIEYENSKTQNDWLPSISNIGTKPTVSGDNINLETLDKIITDRELEELLEAHGIKN